MPVVKKFLTTALNACSTSAIVLHMSLVTVLEKLLNENSAVDSLEPAHGRSRASLRPCAGSSKDTSTVTTASCEHNSPLGHPPLGEHLTMLNVKGQKRHHML
jgi:hypothetical protein